MNRRRFCATIGCAATGWRPLPQAFAEASSARQMFSNCFGSSVRIVVQHASPNTAKQAMQSAFDELARIESIMSIYRFDSQLSLLNRAGRLERPDPMLVTLLRLANNFSVTTESAFDVTVQPLWQVFADAKKAGKLPGADAIKAARRRIGYQNVVVQDDLIELRNGAAITLNGIAQGFATDRAKQILIDHGIEHALLDIGELSGVGGRQDGTSWNVGIQHPRVKDAFAAVVPIGHRALATSGDYQTSFTPDHRWHHILDPRTGRSPAELASVSILAPTATEADALSTALMIMGVDQGLQLITSRPDLDAMFVTKEGRTRVTSAFPTGGAS